MIDGPDCTRQAAALQDAFERDTAREPPDMLGAVHWLGEYLAAYVHRLLVMTALGQVPARVAGGHGAFCHVKAAADAIRAALRRLPPDAEQDARWAAVRTLLDSLGTPRDPRRVAALRKAVAAWRAGLPPSEWIAQRDRRRAEQREARDRARQPATEPGQHPE
jgi:hypothetical protein